MSRGARLGDLLEKILDRLDAIEGKTEQCVTVATDVRSSLDTFRTQQVTDRTDHESAARALERRLLRLERVPR